MAKTTIEIIQRKDKGEHVFLTGMTRSGKSELVSYLLGTGGFQKVIVIDGKHEFEAPQEWGEEGKGYIVTDDMYAVPKLYKTFKRIIWQPSVKELLRENWERMDDLFLWVYEQGDMVLYDDEAGMSSTAASYPLGKQRLLNQGASKGVSCWNTTQAPVGIHNDMMRAATHAFIFYLNAKTDRKKVADNYGERLRYMNDPAENFEEYMFYYFTTKNRGQIVKFNPIPI